MAAVAGRRLSEGLGRTAPHRGWGLLMPPERSPPEKKGSAALRYPARPRHPTMCWQSAKALCVREQRAAPGYSSRSAHDGVASVTPSQDAAITTLLKLTTTLPTPCTLTVRTRVAASANGHERCGGGKRPPWLLAGAGTQRVRSGSHSVQNPKRAS